MRSSAHDWAPGYPMRRRFASASVLVGEWACPGAAARPIAVAHARHFELSLHRLGSQTRHTGAERTVADPAHVVMQHAGDDYRVVHPAPVPERSLVVLVAPALLEARGANRLRARSVPLSPRAALAYRTLGRALGDADPLAVEESTLDFVDAVIGDRTAPPIARTAERVLVEEIQHVLARRYREKLRLDEVAGAVGVSPSYASRVFRRTLGVPMRRYLTRLRVFAALEVLDERRGEWSRLALELGFASHSHFTDAFVREFGVAPARVTSS